MLAQGINLLPKEKTTPQQKKVVAKISLFLAGILFLYVLVVAGLFSYGTILSNQSNNVTKETSNTEKQIKNTQKKEILELALKTRMKEINTLISGRTVYSNYLAKLETLGSQGTNFTELEFKKGTINAVGSSSNVITVNDFIKNLKNEPMFSSVLLGTLDRGTKGIYSFSVDLAIADETQN